MKAFLIIGLVVAALIGGLMFLRNTGTVGVPDIEVIKRAKERERAQSDKDEDRPGP